MARVLPPRPGIAWYYVALATDTVDVDEPELLSANDARALASALVRRADEIDAWEPHLSPPPVQRGPTA